MNHTETIREISRRLPGLKRRDVADVLAIMVELWQSELAQGRAVTVGDLGKLVVEVQTLQPAGMIRQRLEMRHGADVPRHLKRVYVRFRPTGKLRRAIEEADR